MPGKHPTLRCRRSEASGNMTERFHRRTGLGSGPGTKAGGACRPGDADRDPGLQPTCPDSPGILEEEPAGRSRRPDDVPESEQVGRAVHRTTRKRSACLPIVATFLVAGSMKESADRRVADLATGSQVSAG